MVNEILIAFPDAKVHSGYIRIRCPYHKGGKEARPSMSILTEKRGTAEKGFCHCFACGKKTNIHNLLEDVGAGISLLDLDLSEPRPEKFHALIFNEKPMFKPQLPFRKSEYLLRRGISERTQQRFKCYEKGGMVYMPIFDRYGKYLYSNSRSTTSKAFFVEGGAIKSIWGIEELDFSRPMVICESQIDALSLWEVGVQAVATLGADNTQCLRQLLRSTSTFVLAFDPDDAGKRATEDAARILGKFRCSYLDLPEGKDINDLWQETRDAKKFKDYLYERTVRFEV